MAQGSTTGLPVPLPVSQGGTGQVTLTNLTLPQPNIVGVTNGSNAAAGDVGELISSVIPNSSSVAITSGATVNLTSISLTAGNWSIRGNIVVQAITTLSEIDVWISSTSASIPDTSLRNIIATNAAAVPFLSSNAPPFSISVSSTTPIYLTAYAAGTGTLSMRGGIFATRIR
jgi:hypothetical protein